MSAWMRGNVLVRHERGIGAISFKRLLLGGGAGILAGMIVGRVTTFVPGCISAWVTLVLVLALTHPIDGLPLALYLLRTVRSLAVLSLKPDAGTLTARLAEALALRPEQAILDATAVYHTSGAPNDIQQLSADLLLGRSFGDRQGLLITTQALPSRIPEGQESLRHHDNTDTQDRPHRSGD